MNAFLIDRKLIIDKNAIHDMWTDHFEDLGKPSVSSTFDNDFRMSCHLCHRNLYIMSKEIAQYLKQATLVLGSC